MKKLSHSLNLSLNDKSLRKMSSRSSSLFDSYRKGEINPGCLQFNKQLLSLSECLSNQTPGFQSLAKSLAFLKS